MGLRSFLKSLTKLTFQGGPLGSTATPSFGTSFSIWNDFFRDKSQRAINYAQEIGDLRNSALLMAAYQWVATGLNSACLQVVSVDADGKETEQPNHPLLDLFNEPNPYYGGEELFSGIALYWLALATAFVLKVRNGARQVVELWYEPWWSIRPVWPADGSQWVSGYQIQRNGFWQDWPAEDVFVLRKGVDPDTRMGQSATSALLREYYTDN